MHGVLRPPIRHRLNEGRKEPFRAFAGGLLVAQVEVSGVVVDFQIAHDAVLPDLEEVFGLFAVIALFFDEPDLVAPPECGTKRIPRRRPAKPDWGIPSAS